VSSWREIEAEVPELAALAKGYFEAGVHKTLATLRRSGAPRISGTEAKFGGGELWFGSMPGALKALDLQRDPRFALHSASADPPDWKGDAKVSGRAAEVNDPARREKILGEPSEGGFHLFVCDITELSVVSLAETGDHLVIESWHEGRGYSRAKKT
jgi:hypothetical protein